jgi:Holliday junction resolvase
VGRQQQQAGAALERDLDAFHRDLRGWYVQRNHAQDRRAKGPPDYLAVQSGVAVLFDAKSSATKRWSVHLCKPHQAAALDRFDTAGGHAALYLRLSTGDVWVPWSRARDEWRRWYSRGVAAYLDDRHGVAVANCDWTAALADCLALDGDA